MRALPVLALALTLAACQPDASPDASEEADAGPVRSSAPVATRAEDAVTILALEPGDQWCRVRYRRGDEEVEADGMRALCNEPALIGQEVRLRVTTFDVDDPTNPDGKEVISGMRPTAGS